MKRLGRAVVWGLVLIAVLWVLFTVVFPWVDRTFVNDPVLGTVGGQADGGWAGLGDGRA